MAEILPGPPRLRASRLPGFPCFRTLQWKPCHCRYNYANAIPNFSPLLLPKRRTRFQILSKLDSDSDSDFGLVSYAKCSDGSTVFKFGTVIAGSDIVKADEAPAMEVPKQPDGKKIKKKKKTIARKVISRSERPQSSDVKSVLAGDSSVADSLTVSISESNLSPLEKSPTDKHLKEVPLSDNSARICENDVIMDSISSELESSTVLSDESAEIVSTETPAEAPQEEETGNANILESVFTDTRAKASLKKETGNNSSVNAAENVPAETRAKTPLEEEKGNNNNVRILETISTDTPAETGHNSNNVTILETVSADTPTKAPLEEETGNNFDVNVVENVFAETPVNAPLKEETGNNGNVSIVEEVSTDTPAEAPLEQETEPSSVDELIDEDKNENSMQLGHNGYCANGEEVGASEAETNNDAELPTPVVESHSIEDNPNRGFTLTSGAASMQNTSEGLTGVGDAYFVAENWLGVADGVGHWTLEGVSDALFTRELVENCEKIISQANVDPRQALVRSVAETGSPGSSTILIAHFDGQDFHVANVGDSGFMVIRNGVVFQQSSHAVHEFNFPLHVESGHDPSEHIEEYKVNLDEGDVIITATDGLFDNLYEHDILSIVSESGAEPQDIAESLATKALEMGRSSSTRTPFADAAQAAGYAGYSGGKLDDVAVIVSLVQTKYISS